MRRAVRSTALTARSKVGTAKPRSRCRAAIALARRARAPALRRGTASARNAVTVAGSAGNGVRRIAAHQVSNAVQSRA